MNVMSRARRGRTVALSAFVGSVLTLMPAPMAMHAIAAADSTATYLDVETDTASIDRRLDGGAHRDGLRPVRCTVHGSRLTHQDVVAERPEQSGQPRWQQ